MKYLGSDEYFIFFSIRLLNPQKVIQQDVPLAPVSTIVHTAEGFILSGKLRRVDSFHLGYVAWRKTKKDFLLIPTWVIEGEVFENAEAEHKYPDDFYGHRGFAYEYQKLYINAQTGEVFDPWQKDSKRFYNAPKVIPWKNVHR